MSTSSSENSQAAQGAATPTTRDDVEGAYTQIEPEAAGLRTVPGQYTEAEGNPGPDPRVVGTYIGADHDGADPLVRASQLRHGNYPKAEH